MKPLRWMSVIYKWGNPNIAWALKMTCELVIIMLRGPKYCARLSKTTLTFTAQNTTNSNVINSQNKIQLLLIPKHFNLTTTVTDRKQVTVWLPLQNHCQCQSNSAESTIVLVSWPTLLPSSDRRKRDWIFEMAVMKYLRSLVDVGEFYSLTLASAPLPAKPIWHSLRAHPQILGLNLLLHHRGT
jgi:hypothetical protein